MQQISVVSGCSCQEWAQSKDKRVPLQSSVCKVYDAKDIKDKVPTYFTGCSATILKIIEKKNIPADQSFFRQVKNVTPLFDSS